MGVGAIATVVSMGLLIGLVKYLHYSPHAANIPSMAVGSIIQFLGQRSLVFSASKDGSAFQQGLLFFLAELGTFFLNTFGFDAVVTHLGINYVIARLGVTTLVYLGFSFPVWHLIFRHRMPEKSTSRLS